ncbi:MAG: class I SAM-dependent methyltransferase [Gemmatimonadaceae bacterium]
MPKPRTHRRQQFEITLDVNQDQFVSRPDPSQTNWVLERALKEMADDLEHMDRVAKRFVPGSARPRIERPWRTSAASYDDTQLIINDQQVMQDWEYPYMEQMARVVSGTNGDVLEVGFGMGISATAIQRFGARSHTIIECNQDVVAKFQAWRDGFPDRDIRVVFGTWQDAIDGLGLFDGIFFDTYPLTESEFTRYVVEDVTFARHFFEPAARHLRPGGVLTYYSNEIDSLGRGHQRALFEHFREVTISVCRPLHPPTDCNYWWADSMVVTRAVK